MRCGNCTAELPPSKKTCASCGAHLIRNWPSALLGAATLASSAALYFKTETGGAILAGVGAVLLLRGLKPQWRHYGR